MLEITVEQNGDYTICRPSGELDAFTGGISGLSAGFEQKVYAPGGALTRRRWPPSAASR